MATTALELHGSPDASPALSGARVEIQYLYGIRGVSSLYVMCFHLNNMILAAHRGVVEPLYAHLTDWIRVGDFRVSAFFVISGYLLTLPTRKTREWKLTHGVKAFFARRVERLLLPYYIALMISVPLFVAWRYLTGLPPHAAGLAIGIATHLLLIHNFDPRTSLYINDTLWNVALEFQCYVLFALVLLPVLRRFGPWAQLGVGALIGLGPHFFMHGFLDWTRPWFITLYAMGVTAAALGNRFYPALTEFRQRIPWGAIWLLMSVAAIIEIVRSGIDASYGAGWLQNILLGVAISSLLVYTSLGLRGRVAIVARPFVRFLEIPSLCAIGRFSYSTYLVHFPILRLAITLTVLATSSIWLVAALGFFVYAPLTLVLAYAFHLRFERPFQTRRVSAAEDRLAGA